MLVAAFSLVHPELLWGILAIAVPVLIHLVLRPRPRRLSFPALVLLHGALLSATRASRLRNLLLLAVRVGLLACAALLLAAPTCAPQTGEFRGSGPVACAVILDDSLSTSYRPRFGDQLTLLDRARGQALAFVESSEAWPAGSELTILHSGGTRVSAVLSANREALAESLRSGGFDTPNALPLGRALREAAQVLRSSQQGVRRLVVFTDNTSLGLAKRAARDSGRHRRP